MKLSAIYTMWDDTDLFRESAKNIRKVVDGIILVESLTSNFGEKCKYFDFPIHWQHDQIHNKEHFHHYLMEPDLQLAPAVNERAKRNFGLDEARKLGYTHFIMLDADEFYLPEEFLKEKERIERDNLAGTVCRVKCYFAHPCLTIGYDVTLVPFIHKITPELRFTWNTKYPFAFEGPKREIRIDPTRQMNIDSGVEWSDITMHHYSWIREDYQKKIRNSTARENIERSTVVKDLLHAKEGYYCEFYGKQLEASSDPFNLCSLPFIKQSKTSFNGNP